MSKKLPKIGTVFTGKFDSFAVESVYSTMDDYGRIEDVTITLKRIKSESVIINGPIIKATVHGIDENGNETIENLIVDHMSTFSLSE